MTDNTQTSILSSEFSMPQHVGEFYEVIENAIENELKKAAGAARRKVKARLNQLIIACNKAAGRKVYAPIR